jgi:hypothetical protein
MLKKSRQCKVGQIMHIDRKARNEMFTGVIWVQREALGSFAIASLVRN